MVRTTHASDMVGVLRERANLTPDALACAHLLDGEHDVVSLTYAELELQARGVAAHLAARMAPGSRAVLAFEPGLAFVTAFFGAMFAEVVAVPVPPPSPRRADAATSRIGHILRDAQAEAVLTAGAARGHLGDLDDLPLDAIIATDALPAGPEGPAPSRGLAHRPAFIQYSSGSTARPRGAVVTHANLLANQRAIASALGVPDDATVVTWLPMHHDMGLIGTMLQPIYRGAPCYLMAPLHFLRRPVRWLAAIGRFGGVMCGGPNFAYDLCVQRVADDECGDLDLSSWQVAFCGAEPIRPATVKAFQRRFAPHGFRPASLVGCYGLAEATLIVTGARHDEPKFLTVDRRALERGRVRPVPGSAAGGVELASAGRAPADHQIRIVDPGSGLPVGPGVVGEVQVAGPSVSQGYWGRDEETAATFVTDAGARYLRTGDLGFLHDDRLFITGRSKDVLIIRGRNVHPHDVEATVQRVDGRLRDGRGVAAAVERGGAEDVVVVQEVTPAPPGELDAMDAAIRRAVLEDHEITVAGVALVAPRSVRKTSSGKLRRRATVAALLEGALEVLHADGWLLRSGAPVQEVGDATA